MLRVDRSLVSRVPEIGTHGLNGVPDSDGSPVGREGVRFYQ